MTTSNIFDDYAKIAAEKGLISLSEDSKELKKYKSDAYPRVGSDDISTIEALYNVKPDSSIEYKRNIMEAAHPKSVVIAPSYDRLNGLVENEIERQNIDCNIVMKPTDGNLAYHKYAKKDLMLQLVRLANDLDNQNNEELRVLADNCIMQLEKKKIKKVAIIPWIIGGAIVLAGIWLWSHSNDPDKGLTNNMANALKELEDLKENSWYESNVDETVQRDVSILEQHIMNLRQGVLDFNTAMSSINKPTTLSEAEDLNKLKTVSMTQGTEVGQKLNEFVHLIEETTPLLTTAINNFTSSAYQHEHTQSSWVSDVSGYVGEALHGRWGLIANDFVSAANALETLKSSLQDAYKRSLNLEEMKQNYQEQIVNSVAELKQKSKPSQSQEQGNLPGFEEKEAKQPVYTHEAGEGNNMDYSDLFANLGIKPGGREAEFFKALK